MRKLLNKKGFTLAELLIVVAIIAVLVAIAIPIFTTQLEKSREQTDAANLRSAYAVAAAKVLETESGVTAGPVDLKQTGNWQYVEGEKIGTVVLSSVDVNGGNTKQLYVHVGADGSIEIDATAAKEHYVLVDPVTGNTKSGS